MYLFNVKFYWMVFSIAYGMSALEAVILTDFPALVPLLHALNDTITSALKWFGNLFPGPDS